MPVIPAILEVETGRSWIQASLGKVSMRDYLKIKTKSRTRGMAQLMECLLSMCKDLGSIPSFAEIK
jgi:hypothetical protein